MTKSIIYSIRITTQTRDKLKKMAATKNVKPRTMAAMLIEDGLRRSGYSIDDYDHYMKRIQCECGKWFYKKNWNSKYCQDCRKAKYEERRMARYRIRHPDRKSREITLIRMALEQGDRG